MKYDEETKAKCVEMAKNGVPLAQITKELGPNVKAVERYCKKAGLELPKKVRAAKKEKTEKVEQAKE